VNLRLTKREIFSRKGPLKYERVAAKTAKKNKSSDKSLYPSRPALLFASPTCFLAGTGALLAALRE